MKKNIRLAAIVLATMMVAACGKTEASVSESVEASVEASAEAKLLVEELSSQKWEEDEFRLELISAAEGSAIIAELFAKHMGVEIERWTDTEKWLKNYRALWLGRNKESELFRIEELFRHMEEMPPQNKIFTYYGPEQCGTNYGDTANEGL